MYYTRQTANLQQQVVYNVYIIVCFKINFILKLHIVKNISEQVFHPITSIIISVAKI